MSANGEDFFDDLKIPEERLTVYNLNRTGIPPVVRKKSQDHYRSRNKRPATSWRTGQADRVSSHHTLKKNDGFWRNRDPSNGEISRSNDDENNLFNAESTASQSSTFNVLMYSRSSSRPRTAHKDTEQTKYGGSYNLNDRSESNNFHEKSRRNHRNASYRFDKLYKPINNDESGRSGKPNKRDDWNEFNRTKIPNQELFIGYKYLKSLSEKEPHEIICDILRPKANIDVILKKKELPIDWIILIMETLRKLCESDFKSNRGQVLQYFGESPLMDHISHCLGEIGMVKNQNTIKNLTSLISDLITFYSAVIHTIPTVAFDKNFNRLLTKTKIGIDQMKMYLKIETDETIIEKLTILEKILENEEKIHDKKKERPRKKYFEIISGMLPPNDFRDLSPYPTQEDLNRRDFGFVRPNKIVGAYENVDHYLDVQFRLIREDFIDPLRSGLLKYKNAIALHSKPKYKYESVRLYPNSRFENIEMTSNQAMAYIVNFNVNGSLKVKWEYSKRFMFGSLLLFTRDNFESFFFATVSNRDLEKLKKGNILVTLVGSEPLEQKTLNQSFMMAESEVYFEPYYLVMKALKEYSEDDFPMKNFIVDGDSTISFPQYMLDFKIFSVYEYPVDVSENIGWPIHSSIGFDEHQFNAFKTALTSNFAVIQGPPGTGKTYLGLKIVEVLLNNIAKHSNFFKTPILLVCYTNHALDQFLKGVLKFTPRIVRVGGQSKSDELIPYNLRSKYNMNRLRSATRNIHPTMKYVREKMNKLLYQFEKKKKEKNLIEYPQGILSYHSLSDVMGEYKKIINDSQTLCSWLLDINNDPFFAGSLPKSNAVKNSTAYSVEPKEIAEAIYIEDEDETVEADVLVNEDDVFCAQEVNPNDVSVEYCLTMQDLNNLLVETQNALKDLHIISFNNFSEFYNCKLRRMEDLRICQVQFNILNHFLQNSELDSSTKCNQRHKNLFKMPLNLRWSVYWSWLSKLKHVFDNELKDLENEYRSTFHQYGELKQLEDFYVIKDSLVVGMTTTCAARLQLLLKTLNPAIVIVEEAAEVLEAHIVVSLSKNCQQVILIGDHKQLKPSAAVYELSKKYNINVSLFERMINNHMYCPQLKIQHRMRPEISSLIVPSIYPDLKNHKSVIEYPDVIGITKNMYFVEHNVYEETVEDSSSRKNRFEADFMIQLCRYILLQGYLAEQITILTTYTGQMFLLREMKRDYAIMKDVKVTVVDKYQGEENDIILLSLVRSNEERNIGFLGIENRVCVALSRAKIGLYIIGNMDILSDSSLWKNIKEELVKQEAIGPKLTLFCDIHDIHTHVSCKSDFNKVLEGGCNNFCNEILDCGHKCQLICHKINRKHLEKKFREKCLRQCIELHPCKKYCYEECGECSELIERVLPCGHKMTLRCYEDYQKYPCQVELSVVLELCSHEVVKKCFQSVEKVRCTFPCEDRLECGHQCVKNCHKTEDPDHLNYKCRKPCSKINQKCSNGHKCEKLCFKECGDCKILVNFTLNCGHQINLPCSVDHNKIDCIKPCERKCPECNYNCPKKCFEDCKPCMKEVTKIIPDCGHKNKIECSVVPERKLCTKKCQRLAPCGHKCNSTCSKPCGIDPCQIIVESSGIIALCGHGLANVPCWRRNETIDAEELLQYCTEPCVAVLKCGDLCTGTCGSCWQGRLHQICKQKCGNVLVCGHSCTYPCRKVCPPCTEKCQYRCKHSKCTKNCGVPCVHCEEKCEWECLHFKCTKKCGDICNRKPCYEPCPRKLPCKHDCIGFCGEPCPPKCRTCDEEDVKMIIFGNEDEDDARFVLLEDCGHFIESKAMEKYISMPADKGEIVMKSCPLCKTPISMTLRFMNEVKKVYRDILNVKCIIYGNERERKEIRQDLKKKLKNLVFEGSFKASTLIFTTLAVYRQELEIPGKRFNLSKQALRAMQFFIDMFVSISSRSADLEKCQKFEKLRIIKRVEFILKRVNPKALLINLQQVDEIQKELDRYHRIVDYCVYSNETQFLNENLPQTKKINSDIVDILYGLKCFDSKQNARIDELFEKLSKEVKSFQKVTKEEKRMIHAAMAKDFHGGINSQGHWFTCTAGHYYCITECGGAMEESKCPDCGERIGGQNHQYVKTAKIASDMDGARAPAWGSHFDMRNFQF